jgi:hypothetical protein
MRKAASFAVALLALAGCGSDPLSRDRDDRRGIAIADIEGRVSIIRPGPDANAAYSEGLDLKAKGDCAGAIAKLRPIANIGPGYENAQTALGVCLLQSAAKNGDLSSDYLEGLTWLRRAGDAGWPEAQGALALAHGFGPTGIRNGEEAAYWLTLYDTNPSKSRIGFVPVAPADIAAVGKSLSAKDRSAGETRARAWVRKVWLPPTPAPGQPGVDTERRSRARRSHPSEATSPE